MKSIASQFNSIEGLSQLELFQKVSDICATVNTVRNARELLEISLKQTMELLGAKRGSIFILKENRKDLILKIARGMAVNEQELMVKRIGEGIVGRVAEIKKPLVVEDIARDPRFKNFKSRKSYHTPSFICAPLLVKDSLIGVINISDQESGRRFIQSELQLLDFLATQIALNYRRIELYHKFKNIVKESQTLKDKLGKSSQEAKHLKKQIVLQEKLAFIGKLAGGIAHEFNNPLDGVMRYTNLCLEHIKDDEVVRGYLLEIRQGLNRMANIVRSLLACSRESKSHRHMIDPAQAIEQAIQALRAEIYHNKVAIRKDIEEGLPLLVDLGLEQAISNLLRNALDAISAEGEIRISAYRKNQALIIEIADTGCGISEKLYEKIFEPFYTTKDIEKGCGLGLTIVSEIIKSYNGQINLESLHNKGTTFTLSIPIQSEDDKKK